LLETPTRKRSAEEKSSRSLLVLVLVAARCGAFLPALRKTGRQLMEIGEERTTNLISRLLVLCAGLVLGSLLDVGLLLLIVELLPLGAEELPDFAC
jgi:H+/gluconate symporter-like permease